jgi:hypothetical protein
MSPWTTISVLGGWRGKCCENIQMSFAAISLLWWTFVKDSQPHFMPHTLHSRRGYYADLIAFIQRDSSFILILGLLYLQLEL